jgi:hypothetical protein
MKLVLTLISKEPAMLEVKKGSNRPEKFPSRFRTPLWLQELLTKAECAFRSLIRASRAPISWGSCQT